MTEHTTSSLSSSPILDELAEAENIPPTQSIPPEIQEMLRPQPGVYVSSKTKPAMDFGIHEVPEAPGIWELGDSGVDEKLLTVIPGGAQTELSIEDLPTATADADSVPAYRPPWAEQQLLPRLVPFRTSVDPARLYLEPRAIEAPNTVQYPWRTNGLVKVNGVPAGSGVLVGQRVMLTASHVAPWGSGSWSMEFIPGFRAGTTPPFGSSFVSEFRGYRIPAGEATGYDYVVCRLFRPLGVGLGFMGAVAFGDEAKYYQRSYFSTGYPDTFSGRLALEPDMRIADIDNDSPGLELEFSLGYGLGSGWSGGPLWLPNEGVLVAGTVTGREKDVFDPTRHVISAGYGLTGLVRFGRENWPA